MYILRISDYGQGKPIILIHGWPLSHEMEYQIESLVTTLGYSYDRRDLGNQTGMAKQL
jgi:pimeloyl-ACP methyl ester carboxylesterase